MNNASTRAKRALSMGSKTEPSPLKKNVQSETTKSVVANFFKPASQKVPEPTTWRVMDGSLLIAKYTKSEDTSASDNVSPGPGGPVRNKIAGFDLDGTLIKTVSGNKFARTETDWQWWHPSIPKKLKSLHDEGYQIVIFTNQGGLKEPKKESANLKKFKLKVAAMLNILQMPVMLYAATGNDKYRKPRSGMWDEMIDDLDLDVYGTDLNGSYLVGDAAGREGDFSDSDRHWAMNIGIKFHTPEEFFLGEEPRPKMHRFNPSSFIVDIDIDVSESSAIKQNPIFMQSENQEIIVFVGSPGAGKSTFYRRHLQPLGYERINQDTLKSREKCLKVARELLQQGKSIVVDNTNADVATRALWLKLARDQKVAIRCVYFTASPELCQHNDAVRAFGGELVNPEKRIILPKLAFTGYSSRFKEPSIDEGFETVTKVEFLWQGKKAEREIWTRYWI